MIKRFAALMVVLLAVASTSAIACPADKAKDGSKADSGQMSKPAPAPKPDTKT